jgi:hypothetical protein
MQYIQVYNYIQISEISELSELSSKNVGHSNISLRIFENKHLAIIIIHNILCICMYNTIYRYILTLIFFIFYQQVYIIGIATERPPPISMILFQLTHLEKRSLKDRGNYGFY